MRHPSEFETPGCREVGGDWWFPTAGNLTPENRMAIAICNSCIHKQECTEWAIANQEIGIWGGTTENYRIIASRQRGITLGGVSSA